MSETVIEPVIFKNKKGLNYFLDYWSDEDLWVIHDSQPFDQSEYGDKIAGFKQQSKAVAFCELLKESE